MGTLLRTFFYGQQRLLSIAGTLAGIVVLCWLRWRFNQQYAYFGLLHRCLFYVSGFSILLGITALVISFLTLSKETIYKCWLTLFAFCAAIFVSEITLSSLGINKAYIETRGVGYCSPYIPFNTDTLYIIRPWFPKFIQTGEYKYPRIANNMGFRDIDFSIKEDSNKVLIQTYGDSFTEGDGAPADSSYPSTWRTFIHTSKKPLVQNLGVLGSDPGFYWMQLKEIGVKMKPDVIIIPYGTCDLTNDFFTRGGINRFKKGYWQGIKGPRWEWLYACSYIARLACHSLLHMSSNNFFVTPQQKAERLKQLEPEWNKTFQAIAAIANGNHIKVMLLKKPERTEVYDGRYGYDFTFFEKMADTISVFKRCDLLTYYRDSLQLNIDSLDKYYWPIDGHHNSTGYSIMAKGVNSGLMKNYHELF